MRTPKPKRRIDEIGKRECEELLAGQECGRLGVVIAGKPEIFPVNYALDAAGAIIFETVPGTKLVAAVNNHVVFEVDDMTERDSAWSVVVHGVAHETDLESLQFNGPHPQSWVAGRSRTVRIRADKISGRRLIN